MNSNQVFGWHQEYQLGKIKIDTKLDHFQILNTLLK